MTRLNGIRSAYTRFAHVRVPLPRLTRSAATRSVSRGQARPATSSQYRFAWPHLTIPRLARTQSLLGREPTTKPTAARRRLIKRRPQKAFPLMIGLLVGLLAGFLFSIQPALDRRQAALPTTPTSVAAVQAQVVPDAATIAAAKSTLAARPSGAALIARVRVTATAARVHLLSSLSVATDNSVSVSARGGAAELAAFVDSLQTVRLEDNQLRGSGPLLIIKNLRLQQVSGSASASAAFSLSEPTLTQPVASPAPAPSPSH